MFFKTTHEGVSHERTERRTHGHTLRLFVKFAIELKQLIFRCDGYVAINSSLSGDYWLRSLFANL